MKKILFIGLLFVGLKSFGQTDTSAIVLINDIVVEEFKTTDQDGQPVTSYRRVDRAQVKDYIERIKFDISAKHESLEMMKNEKMMYESMLQDLQVRRDKLQAEIQENKRRIEVYKSYLR